MTRTTAKAAALKLLAWPPDVFTASQLQQLDGYCYVDKPVFKDVEGNRRAVRTNMLVLPRDLHLTQIQAKVIKQLSVWCFHYLHSAKFGPYTPCEHFVVVFVRGARKTPYRK